MTEPIDESTSLVELEGLFNEALDCMSRGEIDEAKTLYKRIIEQEPRLPEPYLELAVIVRDEGDVENAIAAARLGVEYLEKGGQWLVNVPADVMLAHAKNLLGQLLVEWAQMGERPFDDAAFPQLWNEAVALFQAAHELDPTNEDARTNAVLHKPVGAQTS